MLALGRLPPPVFHIASDRLHPVGKTIVDLSRRDVLKLGVLGSAALLLPIERVARTASATAGRLQRRRPRRPKYKSVLTVQPAAVPTSRSAIDKIDFYDMVMRESPVNILNVPGGKKQDYPLTRIWGYNGITPGPNIHVEQGQRTIVRHLNGFKGKLHPTLKYEPWTSVHLHGSASLPQYDGYASDITRPGQYKDYRYPNFQQARTLWYHDHGVHHTAENAYTAGRAVPHARRARAARCRSRTATYDVPLVISTTRCSRRTARCSSRREDESGMWGDVLMVNGRAVAA